MKCNHIGSRHGYQVSASERVAKHKLSFDWCFLLDAENVTFFAFHGRLNQELANGEPGEFSGEIRASEGGKWVYEKSGVDLKIGDMIHYWVFVQHGRLGYRREGANYTITGKYAYLKFGLKVN